jgi:hypothetical protein
MALRHIVRPFRTSDIISRAVAFAAGTVVTTDRSPIQAAAVAFVAADVSNDIPGAAIQIAGAVGISSVLWGAPDGSIQGRASEFDAASVLAIVAGATDTVVARAANFTAMTQWVIDRAATIIDAGVEGKAAAVFAVRAAPLQERSVESAEMFQMAIKAAEKTVRAPSGGGGVKSRQSSEFRSRGRNERRTAR